MKFERFCIEFNRWHILKMEPATLRHNGGYLARHRLVAT